MQGQKGIIGSSQEGLPLEHGSSSTDSGVVEPQFHWTNFIRTAPTNANPETQNLWSMGESSSNHVSHRHDPPASMLSLGDANNGHNVTVNPSNFIGIKPANYASSSSSSSLGPFEMEARQRPGKRKASELTIGQSSSGIVNSNVFQTGSIGTNGQLSLSSSSPDPTIPRLGPSVGADNNRRNVRIRINNSRQQEPLRVPASNSSNNNINRQLNFSSPYPSLGLNPVATTGDNSSSQIGQSQTMLRVPALRRNLHVTSRNRSSPSSSRANLPVPSNIITTSTNISDHPLFVPRVMRNTAQPAVNWNLNGPVANSGPRQGSSVYPSRSLSEALRLYTLSHNDSGAGGQNGNLLPRIPPPAVGSPSSSSQESGIPSVIGVTGHHPHHRLPGSTDRLLDSGFAFPHLSRTVAGASERRGRLASEMRNVLDLIRRGENLRFEDVMGLDQSVVFGMAGFHDRHRDMRLDIDNMSYEELLALEERIGNVSTGLTEEKVLKSLKQKTYASVTGQPEAEPCCICQEEYANGDDMGALECGHDFHTGCIKQWLLQKNSCPVCKSVASK